MKFFRDVSTLHKTLREFEKFGDARRALLVEVLEAWEFTSAQASLCVSTILEKNDEASADQVMTNGTHVIGSYVRGEQQGMPAAWLNSMKETWKFNDDLTFEHKIERYEGYVSPPSPYVQSSYARPTVSIDDGIWAPSDTTLDQLTLFVMSFKSIADSMSFEWIEKEKYNYEACSIGGKRFTYE